MSDAPAEMSVRTQLAELAARVRGLEDREEIARVIASYGPAVDSGSSVATAALWQEDGTYAFSTGADLTTLCGRAQIVDMVGSETHQQIIDGGAGHFLGPARIELDGDRAVATCYSMLVRYEAAAGRHYVDRVGANRWVLRRSDLGWQVVERVNHLLDGRAQARRVLAPPTP